MKYKTKTQNEITTAVGSFGELRIYPGQGSGTIIGKVEPYGLPYGMACSPEIPSPMLSGRAVLPWQVRAKHRRRNILGK